MATPGRTTDTPAETAADTTTETPTQTTTPGRSHEERSEEEQDVLIRLDPPAAAMGTLGRDLLRGAVGGLVAGAVFAGLAAWSAGAAGGSPFDAFRVISTMVLGGEPAQLGRDAIVVGAAVHGGFALLAGLLFGLAAPFLRRHDALLGTGIAYGGALYVVNLLVFGQVAYPLFQEAEAAFVLAMHLLFGALLGAAFAGVRLPGEAARDILGQPVARAAGALSAAVVAFLHLAVADQFLGDDRYVGVVVVAVAVAMTYVAVQLVRRASLTAWIVGGLVSVGMITVYVLARTTGLPSISDSGGGLLGLAAVVAEGVFLLALVGAMIGRRRRRTKVRKVPRRRSTHADMSAKEATAR